MAESAESDVIGDRVVNSLLSLDDVSLDSVSLKSRTSTMDVGSRLPTVPGARWKRSWEVGLSVAGGSTELLLVAASLGSGARA
jgi:hypothetical protein